MTVVTMKLAYSGAEADDQQIDFYDVGRALIGFQRSLALTTHLVLNNEIIVQATALKGASIRAASTSAGSWEITALIYIAATVIFKIGTTSQDTPLGHLVYSAYDYIVKATTGRHVDYEKSLGQLAREDRCPPSADQLDQLTERCVGSVKDMHRPIVGEKTAAQAQIVATVGQRTLPVGEPLNETTYEHIAHTFQSARPVPVRGRVTSYNTSSFKGRAFLPKYGHQVPFELSESARSKKTIELVTDSLVANAITPTDQTIGNVELLTYVLTSNAGTIKRLRVVKVSPA